EKRWRDQSMVGIKTKVFNREQVAACGIEANRRLSQSGDIAQLLRRAWLPDRRFSLGCRLRQPVVDNDRRCHPVQLSRIFDDMASRFRSAIGPCLGLRRLGLAGGLWVDGKGLRIRG